ncbi:ribokinase [Gracilibacillus caseinilyticus]|uniref:Ribokinase n=1 Tax=Gracilibacillus caseinilyticus TaxID=2932256 RepID=A0ABY4EXR5_9BACI|nr:ribokinase [Gracilibacillus caseinilyticus]UOQ49048.1 ribokinase [Gracilibacillus caseinilyticus]
MTKPRITVVGSINTDMVTETDAVPSQGETVRAKNFHTVPGGKGANQAVAAARLGADVTMIGCVGDDPFADSLLTNLQDEQVSAQYVDRIQKTPSGLANIILSEQDNRIMIVAGANQRVTPDYIKERQEAILNSDYVLLQFEIPKETIEYCMQLCKQHSIPVIVNPAPAMALAASAWDAATYITPNETEWSQLFQEQNDEKLIITKGKAGVSYWEDGIERAAASHPVQVVDTTGAGDTFNGALAVALAEKCSLTEAVTFANAAAAISVGKIGAQAGIPTKQEVEAFLTQSRGR